MLHKFKIGTVVNYHPKTACLARHAARIRSRGSCRRLEDKQRPNIGSEHFSEEFERVAFENELIAGGALSMASMTTTPVLRTRCTKAMNLKAPTRLALRRGERQQRLEGQQATGSELPRHFIIRTTSNASLCEQPASFSSSYTNVPLSDFKLDAIERDRPLRLSGHGGSSRNMRGDRKPLIASSSAVRSRAAP